eukprot:g2780.t1
MFKFGFYAPPAAAAGGTTEGLQGQQPNLTINSVDGGADDDHHAAHVAKRVLAGALRTEAAGGPAAVPPEQAVAWQSKDLTLVRVVPSANACHDLPEESDLVPGVYEGGLKVWEASLDLVQHLVCPQGGSGDGGGGGGLFAQDRPGRARQSVLELGCGHGFPGIVALQQGWRVCFSDFNREVIEQVTIPNVRLNVEERHWPLAEFFSGDWGSLSPLLEEGEGAGLFDVILTAETLYTTAVADKVLGMVLRHLAPGGRALVASKRFYFGTGGSTQHFRDAAAATGRLLCSDATVVDTGKGNIREVLRVTWREEDGAAAAAAALATGESEAVPAV